MDGAVMCKPEFVYFDMGNVLLDFDHRRAARQMAEVAGIDPERAWQVVFASGLNDRYDAGELTTDEFFAQFCSQTNTHADRAQLERAASDIFAVNVPVKALVAQLQAAGYRLGLLSNTCELHWRWICQRHYAHLPAAFESVVLSYQERLVKPDRAIYLLASQRAGVEPARVFYVDDVAENVAGARAAGWDAVRFTTANDLARDVRARGLRFNF